MTLHLSPLNFLTYEKFFYQCRQIKEPLFNRRQSKISEYLRCYLLRELAALFDCIMYKKKIFLINKEIQMGLGAKSYI